LELKSKNPISHHEKGFLNETTSSVATTMSNLYRLLGRFDLPREISVGGELYKSP
jgi:hypothetical protein